MADQEFRIKKGLRVQDALVINDQGNIAHVDRLPEIPIAKVTGLQTALEAAANTGGGGVIEGVYDATEYTDVADETTFTLSYDVGLVQVLYNGTQLAQSDYTANNGTSIVLSSAVSDANDVITILRWGAVSESNIIVEAATGGTAIKRTTDGRGKVANATESDDAVALGQLNISNWNTAYGWGDHAQAGYQAANTAINTSNIASQTVAAANTLTTARTIALSGDVSGSVAFDGSANVTITAAVADDSHNHIISNVDGLQDALDLKAPLESAALTGIPTAPTANAGTNTTQLATTAFVQGAVAGLVDTAPETLDTLNELAAALGDDPNFATTVTNSIAGKVSLTGDETVAGVKTFSNNSIFNGNVGIGTSTPATYLEVVGNTAIGTTGTSSVARFGRPIGSGVSFDQYADFKIGRYQNAGGLYESYTRLDIDLRDNTVDSTGQVNVMTLTNAGNVGIGTSSPSTRLDLGVGGGGVGFVQTDWKHKIVTSGHVVGTEYHYGDGTVYGYNYANANGYNLNAVSAVPIIFHTNNTERMRITADARVGIGTSTPQTELHVIGTSLSSGNSLGLAFHARQRDNPYTSMSETGSGAMSVFGHNARASDDFFNRVVAPNGGWHGHFIRMYYDHGIAFHTSSGTKTAGDILYDFGNPGLVSSGTAERMTITPDGNVGIGTSSPTAKLNVIGGVNVTGAMTAQGGGTILESLNVSNINMNQSGFDRIVDDNSGGGVTWAPIGPGYIGVTNTSGGHSGQWGFPVNIPNAGWWRFRIHARITTTNGNIHPNTPADNVRFTIGLNFQISGGPTTGQFKWDANALGDGVRVTHLGGVAQMTAGNKQINFNTDGYAGVKHVYILGMFLERVA